MTTEGTMTEALADLAQKRQAYEQAKAALDAKRKAFDDEHRAEIEAVAEKKVLVDVVESAVRTQAVDCFKATGSTKPANGVEVKLWTVAVFDPDSAREWAMKNIPALMRLDEKAYEKLLKEVRDSDTLQALMGSMPGAITKDPRASIARDLSMYTALVTQE
jgi:hypothetical protein